MNARQAYRRRAFLRDLRRHAMPLALSGAVLLGLVAGCVAALA